MTRRGARLPAAPGGGRRAWTVRDQTGVALLLTVWLLAVLGVLAGEFLYSSRVKAAAERNQQDGIRAQALALAGYRSALAALAGKIQGASLDDEGSLVLRYDGESAGVAAEEKDVAFGDGSFSWRIEDLDGRVNINTAKRAELAKLLAQVGVEVGVERDTIADSILDWRDADREHHLNGAEEDYYRALDPPYSAKDGPLDVPEELLLVRGMRERYFTGWEKDGRKYPGLRDLVTTISTSFNAATAPQAVLDALLLARPVQPPPPSRTFAVTATGRTRGLGLQRTLRAVVVRDDEGDRIVFPLVYWNDNYFPVGGGEGETR